MNEAGSSRETATPKTTAPEPISTEISYVTDEMSNLINAIEVSAEGLYDKVGRIKFSNGSEVCEKEREPDTFISNHLSRLYRLKRQLYDLEVKLNQLNIEF